MQAMRDRVRCCIWIILTLMISILLLLLLLFLSLLLCFLLRDCERESSVGTTTTTSTTNIRALTPHIYSFYHYGTEGSSALLLILFVLLIFDHLLLTCFPITMMVQMEAQLAAEREAKVIVVHNLCCALWLFHCVCVLAHSVLPCKLRMRFKITLEWILVCR
jgi:hypothetical protein